MAAIATRVVAGSDRTSSCRVNSGTDLLFVPSNAVQVGHAPALLGVDPGAVGGGDARRGAGWRGGWARPDRDGRRMAAAGAGGDQDQGQNGGTIERRMTISIGAVCNFLALVRSLYLVTP